MNRWALLSTAYLAPVQHYALMYAYGRVCFEACERYVKQSFRNRCVIATAGGVQTLTVPVVKPSAGAGHDLIKDIRISDHGNWRHLHWNALEAAYGKSPFFEFYADDFLPFYTRRWDFLFDFNEAIRETVCRLLDLQPLEVCRTAAYGTVEGGADDFRPLAEPGCTLPELSGFRLPEYYQVFTRKWGFLSNLSIADLLFNMGPEALLVLRDSVRKNC